MDLQSLSSPLTFLGKLIDDETQLDVLKDYESWWRSEGVAISAAVDRAGTPWLRRFDEYGKRVDEILFPPEYWKMLKRGYQAGVIWRPFADKSRASLRMHYLIDYVTCFFDAGLGCPYIVSMSTAVPIKKYGTPELQERFLPKLLRRDENVWQGATWMTEIKGGSDLGATVETTARYIGKSEPPAVAGGHWILNGDKYFASNVGAELAIVAARPEGAPKTPQGLALFLVPRYRDDGQLNHFIRRIKNKIGTRSVPTGEVELRNSEAYLLGKPEWGIYLILESLNLSRVGNITGSVALAQRALADALAFAQQRVAFGKPIIEHPLLRRQFDERITQLQDARALMWKAMQLLDEVWQESPRYSDRYHLFRLVAHLAKYWTAEMAAQFAKWNMEVHGGMGVLAEYPAERWLREAMILPIWEGTPHRQMLDGLEVMERKRAHQMLFDDLAQFADPVELKDISSRLEQHLQLPAEEKEAGIEEIFRQLAAFTARSCQNW
ncbi:MAG TPA: acyl-CoA dehydrogenase family protein [Pyrinomonadaceae bacterium]|nr:acyl-CoA dehydrogenase family protein [Pyrinomonadaceae bacterium]